MKRSSITSKGWGPAPAGVDRNRNKYNEEVVIDWEVRPCGLLVQKRSIDPSGSASSGASSPMIKVKVSHDSYQFDVSVPAQSSFGDFKRILAHEIGLEPNDQRLLFRGKEKDDKECLHMAGVGEMSKLVLLEDPASKERKIQEIKQNCGFLKAYEAVAKVRAEIDKLSDKAVMLEKAVQIGTNIPDKEFIVLTELFMVQLLKLDSIKADGEAKMQRRTEVHRIQRFVDALDNLKARNSNPILNRSNFVSTTTKWRNFNSGVGNLNAPNPLQSSTKITQHFD